MLELYLLLDGSTVAYVVLPAPVVCQTFRLVSDKLPAERWHPDDGKDEPRRIRVDLVQAATIWYTWEGELTLKPPHVLRGS